jgi:hypothetical protein
MGRPTNITYETVALAAERLIAENKKCNLISIHEKVGGSLTTVSKFWKEYKQNTGFGALKKPTVKDPGPEIYATFNSAVARQVAEMHESYEFKYKEQEEENEHLRKSLEKSNAELFESLHTIEEMKKQMSFIEGEKATVESMFTAMEIKIKNIEEESAKLLQENAHLKSFSEKANSLLDEKLSEILSCLKK